MYTTHTVRTRLSLTGHIQVRSATVPSESEVCSRIAVSHGGYAEVTAMIRFVACRQKMTAKAAAVGLFCLCPTPTLTRLGRSTGLSGLGC